MFYAGKNVIFYCFMFILIFFLSSKKWPTDGAKNRNIIVRNNVNGFNKPTSFVINSILANRIKIAWFTWISSLSIAWGGYWSLSIAWFWHEAIANFPDFFQWVTSLNSASASVFADCSRGLLQTRQDKTSSATLQDSFEFIFQQDLIVVSETNVYQSSAIFFALWQVISTIY